MLYRLKKFFLKLYADISFSVAQCHCPIDNAKCNCENGCRGAAISIALESPFCRKLEGQFYQ